MPFSAEQNTASLSWANAEFLSDEPPPLASDNKHSFMYLSIGRSQYLLPPHTKAKTHYCPSLINERVLHCKLKGEKLIQALTRTVLAYNCRTTTTLGAVCNIPQRQYMELGDV